jgi:hypothetical protein
VYGTFRRSVQASQLDFERGFRSSVRVSRWAIQRGPCRSRTVRRRKRHAPPRSQWWNRIGIVRTKAPASSMTGSRHSRRKNSASHQLTGSRQLTLAAPVQRQTSRRCSFLSALDLNLSVPFNQWAVMGRSHHPLFGRVFASFVSLLVEVIQQFFSQTWSHQPVSR